MELYEKTSYELARKLTNNYSTSFSLSSRLFSTAIRPHIYAIYGLVRVADEIVDTYQGLNAAKLLDELETHVLEQLASKTPFSPNPIVQAFIVTAQKFSIDHSLIQPFFDSMRTDLTAKAFDQTEYETYIYGSAEVIGLLCLKVFVDGDDAEYDKLAAGARALGSAYQKVNFLRDMKADHEERGRCYFPGVSFASFTLRQKLLIEADIEQDFMTAKEYIHALPVGAQKAVRTSFRYYWHLLDILKKASVEDIKQQRLSVPSTKKLTIYLNAGRA